jgi:hypothetical protein
VVFYLSVATHGHPPSNRLSPYMSCMVEPYLDLKNRAKDVTSPKYVCCVFFILIP